MNLDSLNKWLTLVANLGVLLGIIVVAFELRQSQTALQGEASTMRAQMAIDISVNALATRQFELNEKLSAGEELTQEERSRASLIATSVLHHFENLHYQNEIGILDDEIWASNLEGLGNYCSTPIFQYLNPNWRQGQLAQGYRESFIELLVDPCI